jgi:hypothetical protein
MPDDLTPEDKIRVANFINELLAEIEEVEGNAKNAIRAIMLDSGRVGKYPPFNWTTEPEDAHLEKGMRHLLTYKLQRDGQQKLDGEDHFMLGICRITMAYSISLRSKKS